MKKISIKQIAENLGVSITTVSFVINGKSSEKRISPEVTKKILDYIDIIGYRPNVLAQSLRTGKSNLIVCMVEDISNSFFAKLARYIEDFANDKGYKVLFCSTENNVKKTIELISTFQERNVDAYIIVPISGIEKEILQLQKGNMPIVFCDRYLPGLEADYVVIDNEFASYHATKHLLENNFKNVGLITTDVNQVQMIGRETGYKNALFESNIKCNILSLSYEEKNSELGNLRIKEFIMQNPNLDSILFTTNYLTIKSLKVIKEGNIRNISKLGIVTFDDNEFFNLNSPTISAVKQPLEVMAREIMSIILKKLKSKSSSTIPLKKVIIPSELIVRESSVKK